MARFIRAVNSSVARFSRAVNCFLAQSARIWFRQREEVRYASEIFDVCDRRRRCAVPSFIMLLKFLRTRRSILRTRMAIPLMVSAIPFTLAMGQSGLPATPPAEREPDGRQPVTLSDLPPEVRLGVRVETARRRLPVARELVLVEEGGAYLDAIGRWSLESRFPVLIDDGSDASRERIARFVRAFEPTRILRWNGDGSHNLSEAESMEARAAKIDDVAARAWGAESNDKLFERWRSIGFAPPGAVVASLLDRAWPAAAALAAGRGEPILWLEEPPGGRLSAVMPEFELAAFDEMLARRLDALHIDWRATGDIIESVTLCLNMPTRIAGPGEVTDEPLSLTDRIGRHADTSRWGWSGILFGDESESSWRAMCALFLTPERAWLFDGYDVKPGFDEYDIAPAAEKLSAVGLNVTADGSPHGGDVNWRLRSRLGVDAGFIHVNTSGTRLRFNLNPGRPYASDVPNLWTPAIVHFIHSFSAQNLDDRRSIARLWLDRGAYAYVGSVHEPFLQAFQTPDALVQRLLAPAPLGVAATKETGRVWRLLMIGDPLITLGPPAPEAPPIELAGASNVEDEMRAALRKGDLVRGLELLQLLGRDGDAARLAGATLNEKPEAVTPDFARSAWRPFLRTGQIDSWIRLLDFMLPRDAQDPEMGDLLWLALRIHLQRGDLNAIRLLQSRLRRESFGDDAVDLADALRRRLGDGDARSWLTAIRAQSPEDRARAKIDAALSR